MAKPQAFIPGRKFPDISITGGACALGCDYCRGHYLHGMEYATSPKELYDTIRYLVKKGARGVLVSGGFTREGRLPVEPFIPVLKQAKKDFDLVISVHTGVIDKELASRLREAGVDIVDYELVLDPIVVKKVKHLDKSPEDYIRGYDTLVKHGPPYIAPHVPIGFNYGRILYEKQVVDILRDYKPYIAIFLVFIPTKGTPMENVKPPKVNDIIDVIKYSRRVLGEKTILSMGCMRPWSMKFLLDKMLVEQELVDRIVNPPVKIIEMYNLEKIEACCSVPKELLYKFL